MAKYAIPQDSSTLSAWWRAKRYVVSGGVLRPLGAMQAYDPRANYVPTLRGRAEAPYQSLLRVLPRLQRRPVAFRSVNALTPDAERELTAWCAAHGLLGVLPHRTLMACVPVRVPAGDGGTIPPHSPVESWAPEKEPSAKKMDEFELGTTLAPTTVSYQSSLFQKLSVQPMGDGLLQSHAQAPIRHRKVSLEFRKYRVKPRRCRTVPQGGQIRAGAASARRGLAFPSRK